MVAVALTKQRLMVLKESVICISLCRVEAQWSVLPGLIYILVEGIICHLHFNAWTKRVSEMCGEEGGQRLQKTLPLVIGKDGYERVGIDSFTIRGRRWEGMKKSTIWGTNRIERIRYIYIGFWWGWSLTSIQERRRYNHGINKTNQS